MNKVIKKLEAARGIVSNLNGGFAERRDIAAATGYIDEAIEELETPRWYTPEEWEAETGEALKGNAQVWWRQYEDNIWECQRYIGVLDFLSQKYGNGSRPARGVILVCNGPYPPPDNWRPEETE
ncbi:MAG: hypothetical protein LBQ88_07270 [Treponema sp.]|jgi:hypothetical protein|nr:hypothetical protein [Treponema sp.]